MNVPPKTANAGGTQTTNASFAVRCASRPPTKMPKASSARYQSAPAFAAAAAGTPAAASTAVKLYCVSRVASDSACDGSTLVKYSTLIAGPRTSSEIAPIAANSTTSVARERGAHAASAAAAGKPRCGSTIAPAAQSAAARQLPLRANAAAMQMKATENGTTSPNGSEIAPSESAKTANEISRPTPATRDSAMTPATHANSSRVTQTPAATPNGKSESGTSAPMT